MARRGRFGRRRRSGSNLTAIIAALLREQRQAEDRNIFDAWRNGGLFQGEPVTDQRLRDYIAARRDGFSTDDPLWDQWNNQLIQINFKIAEDKVALQFKQGKMSAGGVAAFYRSQLANIPKDSAFYREVAGRAAEWAKSAASAARGAARSRATAAAKAKEESILAQRAEFDQMEQVIREAAQRRGILFGNQQLTDIDATDLQDLLDTSDLQFNGAPITFESWREAAVSYYNTYDPLITAIEAQGRTTKQLRDEKGKFLDIYLVRLNAIDDRAKYEAAREQWQREIRLASGDPMQIIDANKRYAARLGTIRESALSPTGTEENDPEFAGGLLNEINAVIRGEATGPTVAEIFGEPNDAVSTAESFQAALADAEKLVNGTAYYGQAAPNEPLRVIDYPPNAALDPTGRKGLGENLQVGLTRVGTTVREVVLAGSPVRAAVYVFTSNNVPVPPEFSPDDITNGLRQGTITQQVSDEPIGYIFNNPLNNTTSYGIKLPDGSMAFTRENPFTSIESAGKEGFLAITSDVVQRQDGRGFLPVFGRSGLRAQPSFERQQGFLTVDPLLVDSTVATVDLEPYLSENPGLAPFVERRRREGIAADEEARAESQFLAGRIAGRQGISVPRDRQPQQSTSPLAEIVNTALGRVADAIREVALPNIGTGRARGGSFAPPEPPTVDLTPPAGPLESPETLIPRLQEQRMTAAEAQAAANASLEPGFEVITPSTRRLSPARTGGAGLKPI